MALVWLFLAVETAVAFGVALWAACWAQRALRPSPRDSADYDGEEGSRLMRSGQLPRYAQMLSSADAEEGPRAFAEKRAPRWTGR